MKSPNNGPSRRGIVWRNWIALALGLFGLTAMIGDVFGSRVLKGVGFVSMAAPCPKVFCDLDGHEGFACDFIIRYRTAAGDQCEQLITPELYARLGGPYNRRNVYGAALAGAPILPEPLWQSVFQYGFRCDGPLRKELGVPRDATDLEVMICSRTRGRSNSWTLQPAWTE